MYDCQLVQLLKHLTGNIKMTLKNIDDNLVPLVELLAQKRPSHDLRTYEWFRSFLSRHVERLTYTDKAHNVWLMIPNDAGHLMGTVPRHCVTAHYDTVHRTFGPNDVFEDVDGYLVTNAGKGGTPLGADDGAGIWLMLQMINAGKPGYYVFFADEEAGGIGSHEFSEPWVQDIDVMVSLDRMGTNDVVIEQGVGRCASTACGQWLADDLNALNNSFDYKLSYEGSFTDCANFSDQIPECINLSVGYYNQHTKYETLDVEFLVQLGKALIELDLSKAPVVRDPSTVDAYTSEDVYSLCLSDPDLVATYLETLGVSADDILGGLDGLDTPHTTTTTHETYENFTWYATNEGARK